LKSNINLEVPSWQVKLPQLWGALDGSALLGYITSEERAHPKPVTSVVGSAAKRIQEKLGERRSGGLLIACALCLLLFPWWWRSKAARFSLLFVTIQWFLYAILRNVGTGTHHVVLLWPFPHLFVAATLAAVPWKRVGVTAAAAVVVANLLTTSLYFLEFERDGPGQFFSDAITRLSDRLAHYDDRTIYVTDWGMQNSIALMQRGKLHLENAEAVVRSDSQTDLDRDYEARIFADANAILIGHTEGQEVIEGSRVRLEKAAARAGLQKEILEVVQDSHDRPVFEIFKLKRQ